MAPAQGAPSAPWLLLMTKTGMREYEPCMVACGTLLSIFSPSSGKMEQQTRPLLNPHILPDTACALCPFGHTRHCQPPPLPAP